MLRRIPSTEIQNVLVIAVFILTLTVFIFFFVRALRMKKSQAEHMSQLPLQDDQEPRAPYHE